LVEVIAEAGSNHNGDVRRAIQLVRAAKSAGASSVKFQFIFADGLYVPTFRDGLKRTPNKAHSQRITEQLSVKEWQQVWDEASRIGIPISASIFCEEGINLLSKLGAPFVKIASTDLTNLDLIKKAAERFPKLLISTGMATIAEVLTSIAVARQDFPSSEIKLMHCVSQYPCPLEVSNPKRVKLLKDIFGGEVGYSDHTTGSASALLALANGASFFEKHFTIDRRLPGFDHRDAMEPLELEEYVKTLNSASQALSQDAASNSVGEQETKLRARRGIYAAADLPQGHTISELDILHVRPSNGIHHLPSELVGLQLTETVQKFDGLQAVMGLAKSSQDLGVARKYWEREMSEKGMNLTNEEPLA